MAEVQRPRRAGMLAVTALLACGQPAASETAQTMQHKIAPAPAPARPTPSTGAVAARADDATAPAPPACDPGAAPSPLALAAHAGDIERARLLIFEAEQDASFPHGCGPTPLMMAITPYIEEPGTPSSEVRERKLGKLDAAGLMLTRCFDVTGADAHGMTALHLTATAPYPEHQLKRLVIRMLECGLQADVKNDQGVTPLMLLVKAKRKSLARLLVELGADVNAQSPAGESAISLAEKDRDLLALLRKPVTKDAGDGTTREP